MALQSPELLAQPKSQISGNLVFSAATSVQLATNLLADKFTQATLVGRVNVLIVGLGLERI